MADKTSWTKPLARMPYGDCIARTASLEAGTGGAAGGRREPRPPFAGARAPGEEVPAGAGEAPAGPRSTRAQRKGVAAGDGAVAPWVESG